MSATDIMPKRKREETTAEGAAEAKRPKKDKTKYIKNVDPSLTKQERKAARKAAKAHRRALKSQTAKAASKAKAQANAAKSIPKHIVQQSKHVAKLAAQPPNNLEPNGAIHADRLAQVTAASALSANAESNDDGYIPLGDLGAEDAVSQAKGQGNAKARRKAARKAERLALKRARRNGGVSVAEREVAAIAVEDEKEETDDVSDDSDISASADVKTSKKSSNEDQEDQEPQHNDTADSVPVDVETEQGINIDDERDLTATKKKSKHSKSADDGKGTDKSSKKDKSRSDGTENKKRSEKDKPDQDAMDTNEEHAVIVKPVEEQRSATINGSHSTSGVYVQHPDLTALPESDVAQFLQAKQISVKDADVELRPITSFDYLPVLDDNATSSFKGFTSPTPIQAAAWPYLLSGRDVVGVAETGSGKTLAFGVPCIHRLMSLSKKERKHIKACIVSPTRELALQIQEQLAKFGQSYGLKVTCVYGGVNKDVQREQLKGTHIVVATPGRLNDFLQEGSIDLSHADYLVLDEADRMLDKGFEDEVRKIALQTATEGRQTLMFTATWPQSVRDLAASFMTKPVRIIIGDNSSGELRANTRIVQEVEVTNPRDKQQRLFELLKQYQSGKNKSDRILVFCLYKKEATRIEEFIRYKGFSVAGIHGDLSQQKRTESLEAFKNGSVPLLVATDVAARGLDIPAVKLVINVTFPLTVEDYVHRIGRTGRAGQDGRAITFFTEEEKGLAGALINVLKAANQAVPEELLKFGTTVKKKAHDAYGAFYKDPTDMKKATKITFD